MAIAAKFYSNVMAGTLANASITNLTTSSLALVAENKDRRYLLIQNVSDVNVGINFTGGTAAIGGTGTITLLPNGSLAYEGNFIPTNAMTAIAASGSNKVVVVAEA